MRILFIIYGSLEQVSGGYLYDRMVINHLRAAGDTVDVLGFPNPRKFRLLPETRKNRTLIAGLHESGPYDLIIVDELTHRVSVPALFSMKRIAHERGISLPRIIVLIHMPGIANRFSSRTSVFHRRREEKLLALADLIIVPSETVKRMVERHFTPAAPVKVCMPGRDAAGTPGQTVHELLAVRSRPGRRTVELLAIGNVIPGKGYHLLVDALSGIESLPWRLTIAGECPESGSYVRKLRKTIERKGLASRVRFTGPLGSGELAALYRESDIFVFPTYYESYGIALAEALSHGLPFVAFDSGAVGEVGRTGIRVTKVPESADGTNWKKAGGFLIPPGEIITFRYYLSILISDRILREAMSEIAYENGKLLPDWAHTCLRFSTLIHPMSDTVCGSDS